MIENLFTTKIEINRHINLLFLIRLRNIDTFNLENLL